MQAMIFAAGIGSRLKPFTLSHPKALVEVGGVPMLSRVIDRLRAAGVRHVVVNVHHFADQIIDHLRAHAPEGVDIVVSDESDRLLDTGGGLLKASPLLHPDEPVLLHNADILTDLDFDGMLTLHTRSQADATLLATPRESSRCLWFDPTGRMCGWGNRKDGHNRPADLDTAGLTPLAFGGIHIINPTAVLPALESFSGSNAPEGVFSITDFYIHACSALNIRSYTPARKFTWFDVGRPDSLEAARKSIV